MIRLLKAEYQKLQTVWSTYLIVGIIIFLDITLGLLTALVSSRRHGSGGDVTLHLPHGSYLWFFNGFQPIGDTIYLLTMVLGVIIVTSEYRHKTITPAYLVEPRRGMNVSVKLLASLLAGAALGVLTSLVALALGWSFVLTKVHSCGVGALLSGRSISYQGMSQAACHAMDGTYYVATNGNLWTAWWHVAPGFVAAGALFCVYGAGLGALVKNQVVGIVVGLVFTLVIEGILGGIWPTVGEYLPGGAASAVENINVGVRNSALLPWWGGAIMLVVYGTVLAVISSVTTLRADIT